MHSGICRRLDKEHEYMHIEIPFTTCLLFVHFVIYSDGVQTLNLEDAPCDDRYIV